MRRLILVQTDEWDAHDHATAKWLCGLPSLAAEHDGYIYLIKLNRARPARSTWIKEKA